MFFGPSVGGLIIRETGMVISVFYISTSLHCLFTLLIFTVLPEPLSERRMRISSLKYEEELRLGVEQRGSGGMAGIWAHSRRLFKFLSPLSIFIPELIEHGNPLKRQRRDWNLTFFAIAYGLTTSIMVCKSATLVTSSANPSPRRFSHSSSNLSLQPLVGPRNPYVLVILFVFYG